MFTGQHLVTEVYDRIVDDSGGLVDSDLIFRYGSGALRHVRRMYDLPNGNYHTPIVLYNDVVDYEIPSGYKDFISITEYKKGSSDLDFHAIGSVADFRRNFNNHNLVCDYRNGNFRGLLVDLRSKQMNNVTIHDCDQWNQRGTWVASDDASNVRTNTEYIFSGSGSVAFDITPSAGKATMSIQDLTNITSGYLSIEGGGYILTEDGNTILLEGIDASDFSIKEIGGITARLWFPSTPSDITSIILKFGSDTSNYWSQTVTTGSGGRVLQTGWNTLVFDWATMTKVGTPDASKIYYLNFTLNYPNTMTAMLGVSIDDVRVQQKFIGDLEYSSDNLVWDATALVPKETIETLNDVILIDPAFTDWISCITLEEIFNTHYQDQIKAGFYANKRMIAEDCLFERFPPTRTPKVQSWNEDDEIQYLIN